LKIFFFSLKKKWVCLNRIKKDGTVTAGNASGINDGAALTLLATATKAQELNWNIDITNVNGSGIGLGHPVGAPGAPIIVTLIYEMKKRNSSYGLATLCGGGGLSLATIIENI
jgi:acetyl-CoA C-acetyltransferase